MKVVIGEENYRLLLDYYDANISSEALAHSLGIGVFALRTRVHRIIKKLRKIELAAFSILYVTLFGFTQLQGGGEHTGAGKGRKSSNRSGKHRFLTFPMVAAIRDHESAKPWQEINPEV